jgi:uncharacterized membrane protein YqjE
VSDTGEAKDRSVAELVLDVSERTSVLIREEIELAKTEIKEKVSSLVRGSVVGAAAGIFAVLGLIMAMHAIAWLLNDLFFSGTPEVGFAIEAGFWFVVAGLAGMVALRAVRKGSPPTPEMAIEEAKLTKETLEGSR